MPATLRICRDRLTGWLADPVSFTCRLVPAASFEVSGLGLGPAAGCSRSASDGSRRVEPGALSRVLEGSGSAKYRYECVVVAAHWSCAYSDMFAPTNARCTASRALFLAPQHSIPCRCPAGVVACRAAGTSTPYTCCSRIGMPCSGTPDVAQGSPSFCGTAECIQDASLSDGCWLAVVSFSHLTPRALADDMT